MGLTAFQPIASVGEVTILYLLSSKRLTGAENVGREGKTVTSTTVSSSSMVFTTGAQAGVFTVQHLHTECIDVRALCMFGWYVGMLAEYDAKSMAEPLSTDIDTSPVGTICLQYIRCDMPTTSIPDIRPTARIHGGIWRAVGLDVQYFNSCRV